MMLIRLYPYVFIDNVENKIILYNMTIPSFHIFEIEGDITISNRNAFFMDFTNANAKTARDIEAYNYGVSERECSVSEISLSDYSTEIYEGLKFLPENLRYDAKTIVKRLFVNLSNSIDVFTGYKRDIRGCGVVNYEYELRCHIFEFTSLTNVVLFINKFSFSLFRDFYKTILPLYKIEVVIPLFDYLILFKEFTELGICDIILLVYDIEEESIYNLLPLMVCDKVVQVNLYVRKEEDLCLLDKYSLLANDKVRIKINPKSDLAELEKILSYDIKQLLSMQVSKNKCIRNEWINSNFWGDVYIDENGNILLNSQKTIGKISEWNNAHFYELISEESLWRETRCKKDKCKDCLFRNICPPISLVEKMFNSTFCNIK